ncbi:hypothetical protein SGFS_036580 [Streptomyces graminofaciens]|uniref:DUF4192 domain-containing protein n=1 Tax=Streptomyces graminofaciens TaxID=68212 RepID=A0ABN5VGR7_9ACTN|nr:DUF4192 family protein [Streptomyces graminofaciens]BBC32364.1 hypothetical protein SGFS_036580 [Streptomyces graminofaciens]
MTNHSEAAGTAGNGDINGQSEYGEPAPHTGHRHPAPAPYTGHGHLVPAGPSSYAGQGMTGRLRGEQQVTLRTPAELADALPYLLGYRPEDSIVLVALHDGDGPGRFGGRARLGIPAHADDWPSVAQQLAHGLVTGSERRGVKPGSMVAFLCQDPSSGESGREVMERLRPLAQLLRRACGSLDVPVVEALCISDGRFWSYCCPGNGCCAPDGQPMGLPGTSVLAAAATYAGLRVRGSLRELRARLMPWETAAALRQEEALDAAQSALVPRILDAESRAAVGEETLALAHRVIGRLTDTPPPSDTLDADLRDDELLGHEDAATLILGLQDRATRDRAAEWMEGDEAAPAVRLWRALARRCVGPYGEHAAAPLTLVGWVAWSTGDELEAREALAMALAADPDYLFARLLHQACNEGLDPESIRRCLRAERKGRDRAEPILEPASTDRSGPVGRQDQATASQKPVAPEDAVIPDPADEPTPSERPRDTDSRSDQPCATSTRRRRRPRPEEGTRARGPRRSPGGADARRPHPHDDTSAPTRRPGRTADGATGRARARHGDGGQGTEGDT